MPIQVSDSGIEREQAPGREQGLPSPDTARGLSTQEAARRAAAGLANIDTSRRRRDRDVIRDNVLTFFNLVLGALIVSLLAVGEFRDGLFVGIVVIANIVVATVQELRATHQLRNLVGLTAPRVTVRRDGRYLGLPAAEVVQGDILRLQRGDQVVADGPVLEGSVEVDESLLTGEADPVHKGTAEELLSGSFCISGECLYRAERVGLQAYSLRLVADARQLVKRASPLQLRFRRLLRVLLHATAALAILLMISYNVQERGIAEALKATTATVTTVVPEGLLLAMTVAFVIGAVRVSRRGAIVQEINAVEALNYVDVICFDKTGTMTANRLEVDAIYWADGGEEYLPWLAALAEAGREDSGTSASIARALAQRAEGFTVGDRIPFSSERRWSAAELRRGAERHVLVLGAPEVLLIGGSELEQDLLKLVARAAGRGLRTILLAEMETVPRDGVLAGLHPLAVITLHDVLRPEFRRAMETALQLEIQLKVISGDRPDTVQALLAQLGVSLPGGAVAGPELEKLPEPEFLETIETNSVFGRVAPQLKARIIRGLKERGHFVAMVGDGANDVRALREADVAVSMESGTATARAVSGVVLLRNSFEALIAATKEARAVLGNSARLSKLFITKSLYAYVIIIATSLLGLDFPFLPRHGSLTALLSLGIPAIFISMGVPPPESGRDFTRNVLRFALPASLSLAAAAIVVHLLTEGALRRDIDEARTLVSLTIGITALFYVLEILGFEGASWRRPVRPALTIVLTGVLVAALLTTLQIPVLRSFFEFVQPSVGDWVLVGIAVVIALIGQYVFSRYWPQILDLLSAKPRSHEALRGRPI